MPKFSESSASKLATCHPELIRLFNEVVKYHDCTIICGVRSDFDQKKAFAEGKSKKDGVKNRSMHQTSKEHPYSRAVDVSPFPIDWNDLKRFYFFAGIVKGVASQLGIKLRWGGDWDSDNDFKDNSFNDLPHFELDI